LAEAAVAKNAAAMAEAAVAKNAAASAEARPKQRMDDVRDMTTPLGFMPICLRRDGNGSKAGGRILIKV
jgi:predicted transglutaminase-like cysteine proteinase